MVTRTPSSRNLLQGIPSHTEDTVTDRKKRRGRGRRQIGEHMHELSAPAHGDNRRLVDATLKFSSPRALPDLLALTVDDHGEDAVKDLGDIFTEMTKRNRGMARKLYENWRVRSVKARNSSRRPRSPDPSTPRSSRPSAARISSTVSRASSMATRRRVLRRPDPNETLSKPNVEIRE